MIKRKNDKHQVNYFRKNASTVFANGALATVNASGFLIPATASTINHVGVILRAVTATDTDFAVTSFVPVDMALSNDSFIADVSAGTISQATIGKFYDLNASGDAINLNATVVKQVYVQDIMASQNKVVCLINSMAGVDESGT